MAGIMLMVSGVLIIAGATVGVLAANHIIKKKKRHIREEIYQIYD